MIRTIDDIQTGARNIFLFWDGNYPEPHRLRQIQVCLKSINSNEPEANIYLFSNVLMESDFSHHKVALVRWDYKSLANTTVLEGTLPNAGLNWRSWSNIFRIVCLWRWGGTYLDVDDIMVRSPTQLRNVMAACFLTDEQYAIWLPHNVVPGRFAASRPKLPLASCFRFGADPMTNFDAHNCFLERWMRETPRSRPSFRGQVIPSRIFAADPEWCSQHINPVSWSDLLYHGYDGGHHPADQRYPGNRITADQLVTESEYHDCWDKLVGSYGFYLVKNHMFCQHMHCGEVQPLLKWAVQDLWNKFGTRSS